MFSRLRSCALSSILLGVAASAQTGSTGLALAGFELGGYQYDPDRAIRLKLPKVLREISGLTLDDSNRLYGHNDEKGIVYQIDYSAGRVVKRFALAGGVKEDFEGIAWLDGLLYLITSKGILFETSIGEPDEMVPYRKLTNGIDCEIEGLSAAPDNRSILAVCKNIIADDKDIHIHRWQVGEKDWDARPALQIAEPVWRRLLENHGLKPPKKIQPTGLTRTPEGNLIIVASRQHLLLEITATGEPVGAAGLNPKRHRQPEGLAISADGRLLIADEGDNKGSNKSRGILSVYEPQR